MKTFQNYFYFEIIEEQIINIEKKKNTFMRFKKLQK